jgi:hypothetical protein
VGRVDAHNFFVPRQSAKQPGDAPLCARIAIADRFRSHWISAWFNLTFEGRESPEVSISSESSGIVRRCDICRRSDREMWLQHSEDVLCLS